jgi:hypothetical protein
MIDAGARIAELIRENLMLHSKLAKHGLPLPACKLAALKEFNKTDDPKDVQAYLNILDAGRCWHPHWGA